MLRHPDADDPSTAPGEVAPFDSRSSAALDRVRTLLEAAEAAGDSAVTAAWRAALDRLERRLPPTVAVPPKARP